MWPDPRLFDFLNLVVRKERVVVRGALGLGLKVIGKAMHAQGLIGTSWADGPTDGLSAIMRAWPLRRRHGTRGVSMQEVDLTREIERYNDVDCR
jgi:hypothetical protein